MPFSKSPSDSSHNESNLLYDAILYDFDGTLADTVPLIMDSFHHAYNEVLGGCTRSDDELMSFIGLPLSDTFTCHDEKTADALISAYLEYNERLLRENQVKLFPRVTDSIKSLKSTCVKQGIVTSKRREAAMITINLLGIADLFDVFVFREDTEKHKPDGQPLTVAASKLNISDIKRVLYVGDAAPDILCAKNAGAASALVEWTRMPKDKLLALSPDYLLNDLEELSCIIGGRDL